MRRFIISPEKDYYGLLELVETAYEQDEVLQFSGTREGIEETISLKPNLVEKRREAGRKVLEFLGVEIETLDPFIAKSEFTIDELDQYSVIEVTIRDKYEQ